MQAGVTHDESLGSPVMEFYKLSRADLLEQCWICMTNSVSDKENFS